MIPPNFLGQHQKLGRHLESAKTHYYLFIFYSLYLFFGRGCGEFLIPHKHLEYQSAFRTSIAPPPPPPKKMPNRASVCKKTLTQTIEVGWCFLCLRGIHDDDFFFFFGGGGGRGAGNISLCQVIFKVNNISAPSHFESESTPLNKHAFCCGPALYAIIKGTISR